MLVYVVFHIGIILYSVDFAGIEVLSKKQDWPAIASIMSGIAKTLETAGADCLMIGADTMHKVVGEVQAAINIPVIHIADAVAAAINKKRIQKVALLGTKYTMQLGFYKTRLAAAGIDVIIPAKAILNLSTILFTTNSARVFFCRKEKSNTNRSLMD